MRPSKAPQQLDRDRAFLAQVAREHPEFARAITALAQVQDAKPPRARRRPPRTRKEQHERHDEAPL